LSHLDLTYW